MSKNIKGIAMQPETSQRYKQIFEPALKAIGFVKADKSIEAADFILGTKPGTRPHPNSFMRLVKETTGIDTYEINHSRSKGVEITSSFSPRLIAACQRHIQRATENLASSRANCVVHKVEECQIGFSMGDIHPIFLYNAKTRLSAFAGAVNELTGVTRLMPPMIMLDNIALDNPVLDSRGMMVVIRFADKKEFDKAESIEPAQLTALAQRNYKLLTKTGLGKILYKHDLRYCEVPASIEVYDAEYDRSLAQARPVGVR